MYEERGSDNEGEVNDSLTEYRYSHPEEPLDNGGGPKWRGYNNVNVKSNPDLSNHHYFLLPTHIKGFALREKLWSKRFNFLVWLLMSIQCS
jgi:hypothetical protein